MFRQKPKQQAESPSGQEWPDFVTGLIVLAPQKLLTFGSNRGIPVSARPVTPIRKRDGFAPALPITSKEKKVGRPNFFELQAADILWKRPPAAGRRTFVWERWENLRVTDLQGDIGIAVVTLF
jgi:hypothetical protein